VTPEISDHVVAGLDIRPPARIVAGGGNAFAIAGYCYHPTEPVRALEVEVAGSRQPVEHFGLPREDVFNTLSEDDPAARRAYRSGFVAMPSVGPRSAGGEIPLGLVLTLRGGRELAAPLGTVHIDSELEAPAEASQAAFSGDGPSVAICMATYNPPPELLRRQLDSIREQTHGRWICLISDDGSESEALENIRREIDGDERFALSPSPTRLGFYANFERALSMAPPSADFVTLCDQDDRWHPDKLERLIEGIGDAQLVYSDARVVEPSGDLIHSSYWTARRNNHTNFASLMLANSITGAASLFRRQLLEDVLPFPPTLAMPFHDHWLAVVAMAKGDVNYLDRPLYDYVQHGEAVIGHSMANKRPRRIRRQLIERLRNPGPGSRMVYYYDWFQQMLFAEVLRLRCWEAMSPSKRRVIRRLLNADSGFVGLSWLLGRWTRKLWGHDETLDRELFYGYALLRRRAVSLWTFGRSRPGRLFPRDASVPPVYASGPQRDEVQ
jgi:glycosyltransferase involved in cell wall biosynthesis